MHEKELSATGLAKELDMTLQSVVQLLLDMGLIARNGKIWDLTPVGLSKGGQYRDSVQTGRYIVWPRTIIEDLNDSNVPSGHPLTATSIGKSFELPASRVNSILSELGWIKKDPVNGWTVTDLGRRIGGIQSKYKTGVPYVRWPNSLTDNKILINSIRESKGDIPSPTQGQPQSDLPSSNMFRDISSSTLASLRG